MMRRLDEPPLRRVLIVDPVHEDAITHLSADFDVSVQLYPSHEDLRELAQEADILVLRSGVQLSADIIRAARRLRIIARAGVGIDNIDVDAARSAGVVVFNVPDASTRAVAEFAIGLMFAVARKIPQADAGVRARRREKPRLEGAELQGRALGIVGYGRIGSEIAGLGQALGMRVSVSVANPSAARRAALAAKRLNLLTLPALLRAADVICLAVPLTRATRDLIGQNELATMRPGGFLVNVGRAELVHTCAVYESLCSGHLAGAALDVYRDDQAVPLMSLPNVVLTPHIAAMTTEAQRRVAVALVRSIAAARSGKHDPHRVC
jgi:D-3-phosphoglycerate dehydrogenase / 2-oxoglutarate reductase